MEICIISVGRISSSWIYEGINQFEMRIPKYVKYSSIIVPDIKNAKSLSTDALKEEEGKLILQNIGPSDFVVIMDERGKEFTSRNFSDWIQKQMNSGRKRLAMVIGGPFGFSKQIYERADSKISLSQMTLTHELAKLFLVEQIYRALTILKGEPYHHD